MLPLGSSRLVIGFNTFELFLDGINKFLYPIIHFFNHHHQEIWQ